MSLKASTWNNIFGKRKEGEIRKEPEERSRQKTVGIGLVECFVQATEQCFLQASSFSYIFVLVPIIHLFLSSTLQPGF